MLQDFFVPFVTIAFAEMGDKTQLAMMAMAARHKRTMQIFLGAIAASAIVDGSAVVLGSYISKYLPRTAVSVAAGAIFILFGIYSLMSGKGEKEKVAAGKKSILLAAFLLFFVSEFGDKSQLAALLFGTQYNMLLAVLGTLVAIAALLAIMLHAGRYLGRRLNEKAVKILSALLFIGIGLFTLLGALGSA